jgi:RNA polymerase sigma factor (sigma-70 family)
MSVAGAELITAPNTGVDFGRVAASSDIELVHAWQGGDARAGSELFDRHFDVLYRFLVSKVGEAADDLVQQTFTACIRGKVAYRGESSFRAYLFAIARHELYRFLERRAREGPPCDVAELSLHDLGTSPSSAVARKEDERVLLEALRRLPLQQQLVVELYYVEHLRGHDLVAALGIPAGTVRSRLRLALERLRHELEAIAQSPTCLESTQMTLDRWALLLGRAMDEPEPG